jgi:hypothetical protein
MTLSPRFARLSPRSGGRFTWMFQLASPCRRVSFNGGVGAMKRTVLLLSAFAVLCVVSAAEAQTRNGVTLSSAYCKNAWSQLKSRPTYKAMAVSRDGKTCNSSWGYDSQKQANRSALEGCEEHGERTCVMFR